MLVVDDNAQMRTIIGAVLGGAGVRRLHYAPDVMRGLETIRAIDIDVAFVDFEMPGLTGLDFISAIRNRESPHRFLPVVMLTGHSDLLRINGARDRGVTEFLAKPVSAVTILKRLESVIYRPRPFVDAASYFGPDRRRRQTPGYTGPLRRSSDHHDVFEL